MISNDWLKARTSITLFHVVFALATSAAFAAPWCDAATDLEENATLRGFAHVDEQQLFRLDLPAAGILTVDLLTVSEHRFAKIDLRPEACGEPAADVLLVERSATHLVLAARTAGTLFFRAAAHAPRFKLVTSFAEAQVVEEVSDLEGSGIRAVQTSFLASGFAWKGDPEDVNPDPDGLNADQDSLLASFLTLRPPPLRKGDPEDVNPDPDGVTLDGAGHVLRRLLLYEPTCRQDELDDHGDTMSCATPLVLGQRAAGEIRNGRGDDGDVFVLRLNELSTVEVTVAGDVAAELLDRSGQRLAADGADDGRIVSTLAPGRYFLRVAAASGGEGAYELTATAESW